jgi:hypothetical protein
MGRALLYHASGPGLGFARSRTGFSLSLLVNLRKIKPDRLKPVLPKRCVNDFADAVEK